MATPAQDQVQFQYLHGSSQTSVGMVPGAPILYICTHGDNTESFAWSTEQVPKTATAAQRNPVFKNQQNACPTHFC